MTPTPRRGAAVAAAALIATLAATMRGASAGAEPIRIGAVFSETGGLASIGSPGLAGMRLAAAELNARGGVLGRPVELIAGDSRSSAGPVARATRTLIAKEHVVALGGLNDSTLALAAGSVAQSAGIPFVTSGATLPDLPERVGDTLFMAAFGDDAQAHAVADLARSDLRARTAFVLVDRGSDFTRALAGFFRERFVARGGSVVGQLAYRSGSGASVRRSRGFKPSVLRPTSSSRPRCPPRRVESRDSFVRPASRSRFSRVTASTHRSSVASRAASRTTSTSRRTSPSAATHRACVASSRPTASAIAALRKTPLPRSATTR